MKLNLTRPLAFLDIESTGLSVENDRIIELAICKVHPSGDREIKTRRFNPGMPIPEQSSAIHGITDDMVKDEPFFHQISQGLIEFLSDCDIAGFNSNKFDIPMLFNEFRRCGIYWDYTQFRMVDVGNIFKIKEPRTLAAAMQFYCGKDLEGAHGAEADITATVDVFVAQLDKYDDIPIDLDELQIFCNHGKPILDLSGKFTTDDDGDIVFNFGAKRGLKAKYDPDYIHWMLSKDFQPDTQKICHQVLDNLFY